MTYFKNKNKYKESNKKTKATMLKMLVMLKFISTCT